MLRLDPGEGASEYSLCPQGLDSQRPETPPTVSRRLVILFALLFIGLSSGLSGGARAAAPAAEAGAEDGGEAKGGETGRAIPRFVSLAAREVNLRTGPGEQYPVTWKFVRQGLPVEVVAEYEFWRRIRAEDGTLGWVHKNLLSGRRTASIAGGVRSLRVQPDATARVVLRAEPGVLGRVRACVEAWCQLEIQGTKGWITRDQIWGVYPAEKID